MSFNILNLSDDNILIVQFNNEIWYKASDITAILNYHNSNKAIIDHVSDKNKKPFSSFNIKKKLPNNMQPHSIFINKEGLTSLLIKCTLPNIDSIANFFDIKTLYRYKRKEIEIVDELYEFLDELDITFQFQYIVKKFRLDIYLPDHNLVIEIDEHGHKDRDLLYEDFREKIIKKNLRTKILRVNPDDKKFSINKFFALIVKEIYQ